MRAVCLRWRARLCVCNFPDGLCRQSIKITFLCVVVAGCVVVVGDHYMCSCYRKVQHMSLQQLQHIGSELQQYLTLHWRNVATQGESEYHTDAHMEAHGSVCSVRRSAFETLALYAVGRRAVLDREIGVVDATQERKQLASTCGNPLAANESMGRCGQLGRSGGGREHDNGVLMVVLKEVGILRTEVERLKSERLVRFLVQDVCVCVRACVSACVRACACVCSCVRLSVCLSV